MFVRLMGCHSSHEQKYNSQEIEHFMPSRLFSRRFYYERPNSSTSSEVEIDCSILLLNTLNL